MLKVENMPPAEMHALLQRESFGHLGCARDNRPYVVPMHYAYDGKELYFYGLTRFTDASHHQWRREIHRLDFCIAGVYNALSVRLLARIRQERDAKS